MKRSDKLLTIFTPTFNRSGCLETLYESLCRQKTDNFMWLIVDDGSSDDTRNKVGKWIEEDRVDIEYYFKENGGIHTAKNKAKEVVDTPIVVYAPSDCELLDDAMQKIENAYTKILNVDPDFYCMTFHYIDGSTGEMLGTNYPKEKKITYFDMQYKYKIKEDQIGVMNAKYFKQIKYPVYENEKLFPDNYVDYFFLDKSYYLFDECLMLVKYTLDGYTKNLIRTMANAPNGYYDWNALRLKYDKDFRQNMKSTVHMIAFGKMARRSIWNDSSHKLLTVLLYPIGVLWYFVLKSEKQGNGIATRIRNLNKKTKYV